MSEFEHKSVNPSLEAQLAARLKLQRVIFGALALVLTALFVGGLSAWTQMRQQLHTAHLTTRELGDQKAFETDRAEAAEAKVLEREQDLARVRAMLGLEKCRLAAIDAATGNRDRGRALLAEARVLGAPPWWSLVSHGLAENRFDAATNGDAVQPVLCGALSGNGRVFALARVVAGPGCVVEIRQARDGKLLRAVVLPAIEGLQPPMPTHLCLNLEGSEFVAATAGRLLHARGDIVTDLHPPFDQAFEGTPGGVLRSLSTDATLSRLATCWGGEHVVLYERTTDGFTARRQSAGEGAAVTNVAFGPDGIIACQDGPKLRLLSDAGTLWQAPGAPDGAAVAFAGPCIVAATRHGRTLHHVVYCPDWPEPLVQTFTLEAAPWGRVLLLRDGSPAVLSQSGTIVTLSGGNASATSLGDGTLTFAELLADGLVFANAAGQTGLRRDITGQLQGAISGPVPRGMQADVQAYGYTLRARGKVYVSDTVQWPPAAQQDVFCTLAGPAIFNGATLRLPGGLELAASGGVYAVCADGSALLARGTGLVLGSSSGELPVTGLPGTRPDAVVTAAMARRALIRVEDAVYYCDFAGPARLIEPRRGVAPDMMALCADGNARVVVYGNTASVGSTGERASTTLTLPRAPAAVALLFEGTVLATLEQGDIACYEVATGRELLRLQASASALQAVSRHELRVASESTVRLLALRE